MATKTNEKSKKDKKHKVDEAAASDHVDVSTGNGKSVDKGQVDKGQQAPQHDIAPWPSWSAIEDWFDNWSAPMLGRRWPELRSRIAEMDTIRVEQYQDDDEIVVRAEIPGVDPDEDIEITVAGGKMTISGQREQREETKENGSFRSEFRYGSFTRSMPVPAATSPDDVTATYTDGVLEVRVSVDGSEHAKTKVPITKN